MIILLEKPPRSEPSTCVRDKRFVALNLESIELSLQCDMLTNLNSKTESDCIQEEASAYQLFQADQVNQRLKLKPDQYFDQFETVAFRKVSLFSILTFLIDNLSFLLLFFICLFVCLI